MTPPPAERKAKERKARKEAGLVRVEMWVHKDRAAEVRALAAGWRDISTAPKDGTVVLLWGEWAGEIHGPRGVYSVDIGSFSDGLSDYPGNDWWALSTGDAYACWMRPTHWQPLPQPPNAQALTRGDE